jgi:mRNA interferase MazF
VRPRPSRGQVWLVELDPVRGHEQGGTRPGLIVSTDIFNHGPAELLVVLPITSTIRRVRWHVAVQPPEGGLRQPSIVMCEAARSVSAERLIAYWGTVSDGTLRAVGDRLRILLEL